MVAEFFESFCGDRLAQHLAKVTMVDAPDQPDEETNHTPNESERRLSFEDSDVFAVADSTDTNTLKVCPAKIQSIKCSSPASECWPLMIPSSDHAMTTDELRCTSLLELEGACCLSIL